MEYITETFCDGAISYHHIECFDLQAIMELNKLFRIPGTIIYEVKEYEENGDTLSCYGCRGEIRN